MRIFIAHARQPATLFLNNIFTGENMYKPLKILAELESEIPLYQPTTMGGDKWLLTSALQKAIRRGEETRALAAANTLYQLDRPRFWSRLLVIALEDCGIGDPGTLVKVLTAIAASSWRRGRDREVGLHLSALLCRMAKSRLTDAVFILANRDPGLSELRMRLATAEESVLQKLVVAPESPLIERALAIWFLAGTKKFPSEHLPLRAGNVSSAVETLRVISTDDNITEACIAVISRLPWPLALHIPLILQEAGKHSTSVRQDSIPVCETVNGLPLYAADMFTRVGKACYHELRHAIPGLKPFTPQQIGLGVFYLDGSLVDKERASHALDQIQQAGEIVDVGSAGLSPAGYDDLQSLLQSHWEVLVEIRKNQLRQLIYASV
jgi:hypothetical protein